jgi:AcrR family transcriptional regulator
MSGNEVVGRRRRLSPQDRRTLILSAAAGVFAAQGYDRASMREIARASRITTPVLYDHFESKAALYVTLVEAHADALISHWVNQPKAAPPEELFTRTIDAIFSWIEDNEHGWRLLFLDAPSDEAVAVAHRRTQEHASQALATLFQQMPQLNLSTELERTRADRLFAEAAKWSVNAIAAWWWNNRDIPREQVVLLINDLLWRGLERITNAEPNEKGQRHGTSEHPAGSGRGDDSAVANGG